MTDKPRALMTHEQFLGMVVPDSEMGVTYRNLIVALEAYERDLTKRDEALRLAREALEIIAGKRQCLDNLMGNADVAHAALDAIAALKE